MMLTLYQTIKFFHIISASMVLLGISYYFYLWKTNRDFYNQVLAKILFFQVLPFTFIQMISGFTLIFLQKNSIAYWWSITNVIVFFIFIISLITLLFCNSPIFLRKGEKFCLISILISFMILLFLMANKVEIVS